MNNVIIAKNELKTIKDKELKKYIDSITIGEEVAIPEKNELNKELGLAISSFPNLKGKFSDLEDETIQQKINKNLYYDGFKKLFLQKLMGTTKGENLRIVFDCLNVVSLYESEKRKNVIDFDYDELVMLAHYLYERPEHYTKSEFNKKEVARYSIFGVKRTLRYIYAMRKEYIGEDELGDTMRIIALLEKILSDTDNSSKFVTKKQLVEYVRSEKNRQISIVPLLIFEGIEVSRAGDDEMRNLKVEDIKEDGTIVIPSTKGNEGDGSYYPERTIRLSEDAMEAINLSLQQKVIERTVRGGAILEFDLDFSSPYLLKRAVTNSRGDQELGTKIPFGTLSTRYRKMKEKIENGEGYSLTGVNDLTLNSIRKSGQAYYIQKLINEGMEERDAIYECLKRFGEFSVTENGSEKSNRSSQGNRQRYNRLRRSWKSYVNR